jgi:hypothetical protein
MRYKVQASSLNVRSGPGEEYDVWATLPQDHTFPALATAGWVPVVMDDDTVGWVAEEYVSLVPDEEAPAEAEEEYDFSSQAGIIKECGKSGLTTEQTAYVLATTEWETGLTFKPVREAYWLSEDWRRRSFPYYPYYGRGFVQLTWKSNYEKYADILGIDLVHNPDLALQPLTALRILVHGMSTGAFTGKKLSDYINTSVDFFHARRVVNALDKAAEIAALAEAWVGRLKER